MPSVLLKPIIYMKVFFLVMQVYAKYKNPKINTQIAIVAQQHGVSCERHDEFMQHNIPF